MPILELLKKDEIIHHIQVIIEDAVIKYSENIMIIKDEEYINGDYVFMCFETDIVSEKITHIPLNIKDDQYIKFLETLTK
jgi:hypothetical protein